MIDDIRTEVKNIYNFIKSLTSNIEWKEKRFDYTTGNVDYKGYNLEIDASTEMPTWYIWKYTWTSGTATKIQGPIIGAWDDRATLGW